MMNILKNIIDMGFFPKTTYGLDVNYHGLNVDVDATSGNLDFGFKTYQTRFENVYFHCYLTDYNRKNTEIPVGYIYFKANQGKINKEMMKIMTQVIEHGREITEGIFIQRNL